MNLSLFTNPWLPSLSLFAGTKSQIIPATLCAHLQVELRNARPGPGRISPGQHVTALFGLVNVLQVSNTQLLIDFY